MKSPNSILCLATTLFLFLILGSCSDDSTSSNGPFIKISDANASVIDLNDCDIGGTPATRFLFELSYEASSDDIEIDGVEFDLIWSDGDEDPNIFNGSFDDDGSTLEFKWCFRYGSTDWFELGLKILAEDENLESNEYNLRVDKPEGANKTFID